jgi:hypothetical protein
MSWVQGQLTTLKDRTISNRALVGVARRLGLESRVRVMSMAMAGRGHQPDGTLVSSSRVSGRK